MRVFSKRSGRLQRGINGHLGLLAVLAFLLLARSGAAQPLGIALRHWTTEQGLSHDLVHAIVRDSTGFLWLGTTDGLTRFDGRTATVYRHRPGDTTSLPDNYIWGLSVDARGRLWVSTGGGLCWYDAGAQAFQRFPVQLPGDTLPYKGYFSDWKFAPDGAGWAITTKHLVRRDFTTGHLEAIEFPLQYAGATGGEFDSRGRFWVISQGNLLVFDPRDRSFTNKFGKYYPDKDRQFAPMDVAEAPDGRIWVSTWGRGFYVYNEQTGAFDDFPDGPQITTPFAFDDLPGHGPVVWCGGGVHGLYLMRLRDTAIFQFPSPLREPYGHNNTMLRSILRDPESGTVWFGTEDGLEKFDPADLKFSRHHLPEDVAENHFSSVSDIVQDKFDPDRYWISVWSKGLFEWDRRTDTYKRWSAVLDKRIGSDEVFDMDRDADGRVWLAEYLGVECIDPRTGRVQQFRPNFKTPGINHKVVSILAASDGTVWIGCNYEGLWRLDAATGAMAPVDLYRNGRPLSIPQRIVTLEEDAQGHVLIGLNDGCARYDPRTGRCQWYLSGRQPVLAVHSFLPENGGRMWIGSSNGLHLVDTSGSELSSLTTANGLLNQRVAFLARDRAGLIWVGTGNGLQRYNPVTQWFDPYTQADGLFDNSIENAMALLPDGELFVGFSSSFNLTDPTQLPVSRYAPRVALTGLEVLNKPVRRRLDAPIVLRPGENVVSFEFAIIHYTHPEGARLSYKLENFDADWVETEGNTVTYTNLDGGNYTLLVRARSADGVDSADVLRIPVRVVPPFQRTWWFRLLLLFAAAGLAAVAVAYRNAQRRRLAEIRQRIARDLHDDMGSTLSSIRFFSEIGRSQLSGSQSPAVAFFERIGHSATALSESMQDIVWAINDRHDNLQDLATRMREFGIKVGEGRQIAFRANMPPELQDRPLRPDQRQNIYLIFKEAVNNAAKYSGASEIAVRLRLRRNFLSLEVADNGQGYNPEHVQAGNGLHNLRKRATEIGGRLTTYASPGHGVRIVLTVPLD